MKYRALAAFPLVFVAVFLLGIAALGDSPARVTFMRVEIETVKVLGLLGCLLAGLSFDRGDYLRRAWLFNGSSYALLLLRDLTILLGDGYTLGGISIAHYQSVLVLLANTGGVIGAFQTARAWQVAGLEPPGSSLSRRSLALGALVLALIVTGPSLIVNVKDALSGNSRAMVGIISGVADVVALAFIAPVLLTALALRGGLLRWPWALLTTSMAMWLLYDAVELIGLMGVDRASLRIVEEVFRGLACTYALSAGLAQRWVVVNTTP